MTNHEMRILAAGLCLTLTAHPATAATKPKAGTKPAPASSAAKTVEVTSEAKPKAAGSASGAAAARNKAAADSMTLRGGDAGTMFDDMTIEGEDRIRIEFDRPPLDLAIDPKTAPGLAWNRSAEVLERGAPKPVSSLLDQTAGSRSPYLARPYVSVLATGPVVRFTPKMNDVERWSLNVADSRGRTVAGFKGTGAVPPAIDWDGVTEGGLPALPGLVYSFVLEAHDRAGNKRNFVGNAFEVRPYVRNSAGKLLVLFTGRELSSGTSVAAGPPAEPAVLLETASLLNQLTTTPAIKIETHARTLDQAKSLADRVTGSLKSLVLGDAARFSAVTLVEPDAPETGSVIVKAGS